MGLFFHRDLRYGLEECGSCPGAVLADVREREEYLRGHIPGAVNLPLSRIRETDMDRKIPLFLYCLRGTRSRRAVRILRQMGFEMVKSIGGISGYDGMLESGD